MKEKIILGNKVELPYDSIGFGAGTLAIRFKAGDIAALEKSFRDAGQNNLEVIKQCDAEGHVQATHERYDIFREVRKTIGATPEEDVVTVVLSRRMKSKWKSATLKKVRTFRTAQFRIWVMLCPEWQKHRA